MTKAKIKTNPAYKDGTFLNQAFNKIPGFQEMYQKMQRNMSLAGKSKSTLFNYGRYLAKLSLHFNCLPTELDPDQVNDYLYLMQQQHPTLSDSYFKFYVGRYTHKIAISNHRIKYLNANGDVTFAFKDYSKPTKGPPPKKGPTGCTKWVFIVRRTNATKT